MSLLNDFKAELPITSTRLIEWIKTILTKIDTVQINSSVIDSVYNMNRGSVLNGTLSSAMFDEIHNAIAAGKCIEISGTNAFRNILSTKVYDVASDDFYSFQIAYFMPDATYVELSISKMMGDIFLDNKTTISLG